MMTRATSGQRAERGRGGEEGGFNYVGRAFGQKDRRSFCNAVIVLIPMRLTSIQPCRDR